jgi:hypothetical protein
MAINLFTSFAEEDREQLESFRALAKNPQHRLKFRDRSQLEPVLDRRGEPIRQPPRWPTSKPIREQIHKLLDKSTRLVVLVGETTHENEWVDWEIRTFYAKKEKHPEKTARRLIAMRLRGHKKAKRPQAVVDLGVKTINWNPEAFSEWLDTDINSL